MLVSLFAGRGMNKLGKFKLKIANCLIAIFTLLSVPLALANAPSSEAGISSHKGMEVPVYPSKSLMSKSYETAFYQSRGKWVKAGHEEDINQLELAYANRDLAWSTAQTILEGITNGRLNAQNITEYATPDFNSLLKIDSQAQIVQLIFNKIRSYGDKSLLSTQYTQGTPSDYMIMEKYFDQDVVKMAVISLIFFFHFLFALLSFVFYTHLFV